MTMPLSPPELDRYCQRIELDIPFHADLSTLQHLHRQHPQAIPFENLDSWLGREVSLEPAAVFRKLVDGRRGGYCFEHNLLFRNVLETLGFAVQGLAARVLWNQPPGAGMPRTHKLLLVTIDGQRFIADVGFGGLTMTAPLMLDSTEVQATPNENFRIVPHGADYLLEAEVSGAWVPLYRFSLEEQSPADYAMANYFVSTHPQSLFVNELIACRVNADMRYALLGGRLARHQLGKASEQQQITDAEELRAILQQELGIELSALPGLQQKLATLFRA
jgi:N-hydroxyarylamine O-acetyltransferase